MKLHVLLVEDSGDDAALILRALKKNGFDPVVSRVDTPEAMHDALDNRPWDIVLSDYMMPRFSGLDALALLQEKGLGIPFIIISGKIGEETAVEAMRVGASDYVMKDRLRRLPSAIENALSYAAIQRRQKQSGERLRKLSAAIEMAGEAIIITDSKGVIEYVNPAFSRISGYSPEQSLGRNPRFLNSSEQSPDFYKDLWETILGGDIWQGKVTDRKKDGSFYPVRLTISPIRIEAGEITNFVGILADLTEHEELEEKFYQAQKMEAVGTLVSGIAHDFNNLLAAISGNLYLARKKTQAMSDVDGRLERVEMLTSRAADMIAQLMAFARKQPVSMKIFDLGAFIREAFRLHRAILPENIKVTCQFPDHPLMVNCDASQIQQILMNLLGNARDAVENRKDGGIDVMLEEFDPDDAFLHAHSDFLGQLPGQRFALLSVMDNGCGIPEDQLNHIFEPFFTSKDVGKGTGLGLAMVYGAVQSHGGVVEVVSTPGTGTRFQIYLPLIEKDSSSPSEVDDEVVGGCGEVILLADDELQVREAGRDVLESLGYQVIEAADGREAVALFTHHHHDIALVLLDMVMPNLSGVEAARQIRHMHAGMPIIFVTGYNKEKLQAECEFLQRCMVLDKPFSIGQMSRNIRLLLEE